MPLRGPLQSRDVDLLHREHGLHDALALLRILVHKQLAEDRREDLPGEAELVLEPSALDLLAARGKLLPVVIHFVLILAVDEERYRLGELELRAAVQGHELLA